MESAAARRAGCRFESGDVEDVSHAARPTVAAERPMRTMVRMRCIERSGEERSAIL